MTTKTTHAKAATEVAEPPEKKEFDAKQGPWHIIGVRFYSTGNMLQMGNQRRKTAAIHQVRDTDSSLQLRRLVEIDKCNLCRDCSCCQYKVLTMSVMLMSAKKAFSASGLVASK